jgi:protein involved in polysaccharide export with SLBB domain
MDPRYNRTLIGSPALNQESVNPVSTRAIPPITTKSDFQMFAEDAAGQLLRVYGRDLFNQETSTFPVLDHVPVPANYVIGPDDELHVETWGKIDADVTVTVDRNGQIFIPRVGNIGVAGLRYEQLESCIRAAVAKNFKDFDLNVTLGKLRSIQIYVLGSARQPGAYTVSSLTTLIDALFVSGGPSASGSMRSIELRREGKLVTTLDLYDVLDRGDKSRDIGLLPADVIYISPVGPEVAIVGNVHVPAIYELKNDVSIAQALDMARGLTAMASSDRALLERIEDHKMRNVEEIELDQLSMHRKLRDGDVLRIQPISPQFAGTVMLRGSVAVPGRHAWHDGMRISDLIPSREALITRDHWIQQNHLIEYQQNRITEKHQTQLEQAALADQAAMSNPGLGIGQRARLGEQSAALQATIVSNSVQTEQPYDSAALNTSSQKENAPAANSTSAQPSLLGQPGEQTPNGGSGNQKNAYQPLDLLADLDLTDAEINWDYAVIERLDKQDLTTRLISFNLADAISNPTSDANQVLLAGDVITIFSRKDLALPTGKHSTFVQIQGEVGAPGVYRINPGESLRDIIKRAGGLTNYSYLFAMQVNRVSTRKQQQQQLVDTIQRMRKDLAAAYADRSQTIAVPTGSNAGAATATGAEAIGDQRMLSEQDDLINRLLTTQATGRIVLGIPPTANSVDELPDFHLEDGDTIVVPARMDTVQVIGEVYNENSLRFRPGRPLSAYLSDTGGPTRSADNGRAFLIRADGTVIGRHSHDSRWRDNFNHILLMPGDAVVIPPKVRMPGGAMQNLLQITALLSQSAIIGAVLHGAL